MTVRSPGNLPVELTSFVGRREDLIQARNLLGNARLLTMIGPGGVGKTRLALALGGSVRRDFPDGVWFVGLADLRQGGLLPQTIAGVFGLPGNSQDPLTLLAEHLQSKRALLILDNCEHLTDAVSDLVGRLLQSAPGLKVLATSRHVLGVEGEQLLPVGPLNLDPPGGLAEAMMLFEERSFAADPDFRITADNRDAVEDICRKLEGLPLAIELAAANVRVFSPAEIARRLDDSDLLTSAERGRAERHRTLQAVADWSYQLCTPGERQLWEQLSVFAGGFTVETADGVCVPAESTASVLRDLIGLLDKSMIVRIDDEQTQHRRYRLLEPMRQYAAEMLASSDEATAVRFRHRDYFLRLAQRTDTDYCSADDIEWFRRTVAEHSNIREALAFSITEDGEASAAAEMIRALRPYWSQTGTILEGFQWSLRVLKNLEEPSRARAMTLLIGSILGFLVGDRERGHRLLAEHRSLATELQIEEFRFGALFSEALKASLDNHADVALSLSEEALAMGPGATGPGNFADCLALSALYAFIDDAAEAQQLTQRFLDYAERHDTHLIKAVAMGPMGIEHWRQGDIAAAESLMHQAIDLYADFAYPGMVAVSIEVLGWCAAPENPRHAATLLGAASSVWQQRSQMRLAQAALGSVTSTIQSELRDDLGNDAFTAAYDRGRSLALPDAIGLARGTAAEPTAGPAADAPQPKLTRREKEVAHLVADGLTNKEIATRLVISPRTVDAHVDHILTKLGFRSRTQIARWLNATGGDT